MLFRYFGQFGQCYRQGQWIYKFVENIIIGFGDLHLFTSRHTMKMAPSQPTFGREKHTDALISSIRSAFWHKIFIEHVIYYPCFKYRPRYWPISPFLPAADTIWRNRSLYRLQKKNGRYLKYQPINCPISADKSPDISPDMK